MTMIGPTEAQTRILQEKNIDPKAYQELPQDEITKMVNSILGGDWGKPKNQEAYRQRIIRERGLRPGIRISIQTSQGHTPGVIEKITDNAYVKVVGRQKLIRPQIVLRE